MKIRLHAFEPASRANGPGLRAVVWFQGCMLGCPGCFNPDTHDPTAGYDWDTENLAAEILSLGTTIEGISLSGGEPFQQPAALLDLLIRVSGSHLSCLIFTGYTLSEIKRLPRGPNILDHCDVLIAGRYAADKHVSRSLLASSNQQLHLLSDRYTESQLHKTPRCELLLRTDGTITVSGISPWRQR
jgi:anaerobic ribonucleoside-triphosphate reductase activating protein